MPIKQIPQGSSDKVIAIMESSKTIHEKAQAIFNYHEDCMRRAYDGVVPSKEKRTIGFIRDAIVESYR